MRDTPNVNLASALASEPPFPHVHFRDDARHHKIEIEGRDPGVDPQIWIRREILGPEWSQRRGGILRAEFALGEEDLTWRGGIQGIHRWKEIISWDADPQF